MYTNVDWYDYEDEGEFIQIGISVSCRDDKTREELSERIGEMIDEVM